MKSSSRSSSGTTDPEEFWAALPRAEQFELARRVARTRYRALRNAYPNVVSIGAGFATRGTRRRITRDVCLRVLVTRKWRRRRKGSLPQPLLVRLRWRGKLRRVAIPTDVDTLGRGIPQAADLGGGVDALSAAGVNVLSGALCALVENAQNPGPLYVLGCEHVFTLSLATSGCGPQLGTSLIRADDARPIGPVVKRSRLLPDSGYGMDAALARVDHPAAVSSRIRGKVPLRVAALGTLPSNFTLRSPHGVLGARFVSEQWGCAFAYQCGATVRFHHVFECQTSTQSGDSGSPLIGADGTLFGMHFFGTTDGKGFAIPAYKLFAPSLFGYSLALVTDHNV